MHTPWKKNQQEKADESMVAHEIRFHKYLDRIYDIVQCRHKKYKNLSKEDVFTELDKVIECQASMKMTEEAIRIEQEVQQGSQKEELILLDDKHVMSGVPLLDIIINIDWFTAHFEDRSKALRIIKDLFNHCSSMKLLLQKHSQLIMKSLMNKYDK